MADQIEVSVVGVEEVALFFAETGRRVRLAVIRQMHAIGLRLARYVKLAKLSGQALHVRTGHLRQSVTSRVVEGPDAVVTGVGIFAGPTVVYGRAHEFGVDRDVQVRAHLRDVKSRRFTLFGTAVAGTVAVRGYSYHMKLPARSWLRTAFEENREAITAVLRETVATALREVRA